MESAHVMSKFSFHTFSQHEQDLIELAKELGIDIPQHILRILVQLLEEGIHPSAISKLCRDLCRYEINKGNSQINISSDTNKS